MSRLISLLISVFALVLVWTAGSWFMASFVGNIQAGSPQAFQVTASLSHGEVAERLAGSHLINSARGYRAYAFLSRAKAPRAGTYQIHPGTRYRDIAQMLSRGPQRVEREVRVVEGWDVRDQAKQLSEVRSEWGEGFLALTGRSANQAPFDPKWRLEFPFLQTLPATRSLDGYLFPDTYRVWEDELPESLVRKQLQVFDERMYQRFKDADLPTPLKNFDEAIILASIVENEVRSPQDRKMVAGLFLRRMREGMALQSDATLTYITGSKRGRATAEELALTNAYNSYKFPGLPPSPISHPALSAVQAVFEPIDAGYRYFLTDQAGKVLYGRTFEEHLANRRRAEY